MTLDFADRFYFGAFLVDVDIDEAEMKSFIVDNHEIIAKLADEYIKKLANQYNTNHRT